MKDGQCGGMLKILQPDWDFLGWSRLVSQRLDDRRLKRLRGSVSRAIMRALIIEEHDQKTRAPAQEAGRTGALRATQPKVQVNVGALWLRRS